MRGGPSRWTMVVGAVVVLLVAASTVLRWAARRRPAPSDHAATVATAPASRPPAERPAASAADVPGGAPEPFAPGEDTASGAGEDMLDPAAQAWATVDMDAIRKALPDNTYWRTAVPTKDPEVLKARE